MSQPLLQLRFPARTDQLKTVRDRLRHTTQPLTPCTESVDRIILAVNEACMNIIQHGYRQTGSGDIEIRIRQEGDDLVIEVLDFAPPVDPACLRSRDLCDIRPGGLGIHFIREIMDDVRYLDVEPPWGNRLQMRINLVDCRRV